MVSFLRFYGTLVYESRLGSFSHRDPADSGDLNWLGSSMLGVAVVAMKPNSNGYWNLVVPALDG